jgi:hypothetical protein
MGYQEGNLALKRVGGNQKLNGGMARISWKYEHV